MAKIITYKCDRCGCEMKNSLKINWFEPIEEMDFCESCKENFDQMIKSSISNWLMEISEEPKKEEKVIIEEPSETDCKKSTSDVYVTYEANEEEYLVPEKDTKDVRCWKQRIQARDYTKCIGCIGWITDRCPAKEDTNWYHDVISFNDLHDIAKPPKPKAKTEAVWKDQNGSRDRWNDNETDYLYQHKTDEIVDIANYLGRSVSSVQGKMQKLGLLKGRVRVPTNWTKEDDDFIRKGFEEGWRGIDIAEAIGSTKDKVYNRAKILGISLKRGGWRGGPKK